MRTDLAKNIRDLREKHKLTQDELAEAVGVKRGNIGHYEKDVSLPNIKTLMNLAKYFNVSTDYLLGMSSEQNTTENTATNNIFVSIQDQADYQIHLNKISTYISIPGIKEEVRTFEIDGDAMIPILFPGDYVVGRRVEQLNQIKSRKAYIIVSQNGIVARYIERKKEVLKLISEDSINFQTIEYRDIEIKEIWEITIRITKQLLHPRHFSNTKNLLERIERLENVKKTEQ